MALSDIESKVLEIVGLRGDASIQQIAALAKISTHKCRYAMECLLRRELITRRVTINSFRLGYSIFALWFSLTPGKQKLKASLIKYLCDSPSVGYLGEFGGEYEFKLDIYAKTALDYHTFLADLSKKFGAIFLRRRSSNTLGIWDFSLKFLASGSANESALRIGYDEEIVQIDELDHKILRALSRIGNQTHATLARKLEIAIATLEYRIKKLRAQRILVGYQVWTQAESMSQLGLRTLVHRICLNHLDGQSFSKILAYTQRDPSIFSLTQSVGDFDIELCSCCSSARAEREFSARLNSDLEDLIQDRVEAPIVKHHKVSNYPFSRL